MITSEKLFELFNKEMEEENKDIAPSIVRARVFIRLNAKLKESKDMVHLRSEFTKAVNMHVEYLAMQRLIGAID